MHQNLLNLLLCNLLLFLLDIHMLLSILLKVDFWVLMVWRNRLFFEMEIDGDLDIEIYYLLYYFWFFLFKLYFFNLTMQLRLRSASFFLLFYFFGYMIIIYYLWFQVKWQNFTFVYAILLYLIFLNYLLDVILLF